MLDRYLQDLQRELARNLPHEDVQARLAEAEVHLREGIEGRVELGLDPADATRETIEAFGETRRLARASQPAHIGSARARVLCFGVGYVLFAFYAQFGPHYIEACPRLCQWLFKAWIAIGIAVAVASFRARRPRPVVLGLTGLGATIVTWLFVGTTYLNLYAFGGTGVVPRGLVASSIVEVQNELSEHRRDRAAFDAGWAVVRGPVGIEGLRTEAGYRAPIVQTVAYRTPLRFGYVSEAKPALHAWTDVRQRGGELFEITRIVQNLAAISQAQSDPLGNLQSTAPDIVLPNIGVVALSILVDCEFGSLGCLVYRSRGRRRRTLA